MITVITATHRRPDLLYRCIKAIQRQTLEDYEHIIVGDLCPKARKVVELVNDPRIKYYETPPDRPDNVGGIGKNIGVEKASNDIICYCDDDNLLLPNALRDFYDNLTKFDYVIGRLYTTRYVPVGSGSTLFILKLPFMNIGTCLTHSDDMICYAHTKEIIRRVGGWRHMSEDIGVNEDGDLMRRLKNASTNYFYFGKHVAIYYNRMACVHPDVQYDKMLSNLKEDEIFVFPEETLNLREE